jgi:hypothetical protein
MDFSNYDDLETKIKAKMGNFNPKTTTKEQMNDFLNKKNLIDELFNVHSDLANMIATNTYTTPQLLKKIHKVYQKYKGSDKEVEKVQLILYAISYVQSEKDLDYIIDNIYDLIQFTPSDRLPNGYEMLVVCKQLYDTILAKKGMPDIVIRAIQLYNTMVKSDPEKANTFLYMFANNPDKYVKLLSKNDTDEELIPWLGGRGRKLNKRVTNKRKSKKNKRKSNKRKSYKNKSYKNKNYKKKKH